MPPLRDAGEPADRPDDGQQLTVSPLEGGDPGLERRFPATGETQRRPIDVDPPLPPAPGALR